MGSAATRIYQQLRIVAWNRLRDRRTMSGTRDEIEAIRHDLANLVAALETGCSLLGGSGGPSPLAPAVVLAEMVLRCREGRRLVGVLERIVARLDAEWGRSNHPPL
jgi:hypothetical protein